MSTLKDRIDEYLSSNSSYPESLSEVGDTDSVLNAYENARDSLDRKNESESLEHIEMMLIK